MSLGKRHIGRRVAGVGVAVTLMVLGLQAPASAVVTITALSPTSGPAAGDCVVVATGTGFKDFPAGQMTVEFVTGGVGTPAADFFPIDDATLWVVTPALTAGSSYTLRVDNPGTTDPGISSTATFLATTGAGGCAPTITSFTPTCGLAGTTVVITGTNLIAADLLGGEVRFSPYANAQRATHTLPDVDDVTSLSVIVPSGSGDGPIQVTTDVGTVFSTTSFLVPPPDCVPDTGNEHARSITFKINKKGRTSGVVSSTEDPAFTDCVAAVPVKIQRKKAGGGWKTVGKTTTDDTGAYTKKVKNKKGKQKFRALAPKVSLGDPVTDVCLKAKSATRKA
jgi:IPT/TIG domain